MPAHDPKEPCLFRNSLLLNELLGELGTPIVEGLATAGHRRLFQPGNNVFTCGDTPQSIYIHRDGNASLILEPGPSGGALSCQVLPHCIYGLVEVLSDSNFEASLKATTTTEFDVIDRKDFLDHIRRTPGVCYGLAKIFSRRYREAVQSIKTQ